MFKSYPNYYKLTRTEVPASPRRPPTYFFVFLCLFAVMQICYFTFIRFLALKFVYTLFPSTVLYALTRTK